MDKHAAGASEARVKRSAGRTGLETARVSGMRMEQSVHACNIPQSQDNICRRCLRHLASYSMPELAPHGSL